MRKQKNIAILGVGVVNVPIMADLLKKLSEHFSITVYSFIPIDKTKTPWLRIRTVPRFSLHQRLRYVFLGTWLLADHIRSQYSVLHAQSAFPGGVMARFMGKLLNIPWIVTLIGGEVEAMPEIPFGDLLNPALRKITHRVCAQANLLSVMSGSQAESVRKNLSLDRSIEVHPYAPEVTPLSEKNITTPLRLLHVAYHHPVKNHTMLLATVSAIAKQVSCELTIVGANYGVSFHQQIKASGLEAYIKIEGSKTYHEMQKFYHSAHILLHTSWYEGLPTVALEAMAHGAVVCGTHVGLMADLAGTHCLTVQPGDDQQLAETVVRLAEDPEKYRQLRVRAHEWASAHDMNYYVARVKGWYEKLSAKPHPSHVT